MFTVFSYEYKQFYIAYNEELTSITGSHHNYFIDKHSHEKIF